MATKTISIKEDAYQRLVAAKRGNESFTQVVLRAVWPEQTITGREFLKRMEVEGSTFLGQELDAIDLHKASDVPPVDKWQE